MANKAKLSYLILVNIYSNPDKKNARLQNEPIEIGVKNFRAFKSTTDFELRPITLLLGPNSTGKSSLVKLLLFCVQNRKRHRI